MANLEDTINQAISDLDKIKAAIEDKGVNVPYDTDTGEYGNLIRNIKTGGSDIVITGGNVVVIPARIDIQYGNVEIDGEFVDALNALKSGNYVVLNIDNGDFIETVAMYNDEYIRFVCGYCEQTIMVDWHSTGDVIAESIDDLTTFVTVEDFEQTIGDIETAFDSIITMQNRLIGGGTV